LTFSSNQLGQLLRFAFGLCDEADRVALAHFRRDLRVETKPDRTVVTQADREIEERLRERIAVAHPSHGLLGEEFPAAGDPQTRWIIDPIDATANYIRGIPIFATLLALEQDGEVLLGVISAPAMRERWHALRGGGAWAGSRRLQVSRIARLDEAQIFYGAEKTRPASFDAIIDSSWRSRGFGDFWGYALVAEGAGEAMLEPQVAPWDLAAPLILVEEAGGRFTDLAGRRTHAGGNALASNGLLHDAVLGRLKGVT